MRTDTDKVTVRLMSSVDFPNAWAIVGIAGKYMFAVRGLIYGVSFSKYKMWTITRPEETRD
jgi:hypothetical protein